jgi:hypothetical protein
MEWSFIPPYAGLKRTRSQAGLLAYGIFYPTRHAFPFDVNSGLRVAFVADYSCEGSGGLSPRFPNTCGAPGCQCGLTEALVCFHAKCHCRHNSEPRAHDPQSAGFCKDGNFDVQAGRVIWHNQDLWRRSTAKFYSITSARLPFSLELIPGGSIAAQK